MPSLTVVIPTWNEEKDLPKCIQALSLQTTKNFKVLVIDNHSTDKTISLCKQAGWEVHPQQQPGISAARDEGFRKVTSDIIASTNADTEVPPDWIENITKLFSQTNTVCVYGPVIFKHPRSLTLKILNKTSRLLFKLGNLTKNDHPIGENFAITKDSFYQVGGFNKNLPTAEDVDLCYRIAKIGKIVYSPLLEVRTSPRRLENEGLHFYIHHIGNFIRLKLFDTASSDFKPYR